MLDPFRTLSELMTLRERKADHNGAQRVAFTPAWNVARTLLREQLAELPVTLSAIENSVSKLGSASRVR